ncbi:MAG: hypothetical protein AAB317_03720, partial [Nitrospirota bacterium]
MFKKKQTLLVALLTSCLAMGVAVPGMRALFSAPYIGIDFDWDPQGGRITAIDPSGPAGKHPEWIGSVVTAIEDF